MKCKVKNCNRKYYAKSYCRLHYLRKRNGVRLNRPDCCKTGIGSLYPNISLLKKHRLIILTRHSKCEKCGKFATDVHHRNLDKSDHRLRNLMPSCRSCNVKLKHKPNTSKYRRFYGYTLIEMSKRFNLGEAGIRNRLIKGIPLDLPKERVNK